MAPPRTLVVRDPDPSRDVRALVRAVAACDAAAAVVVVTARPRALPAAVARRARVVGVRRPADVAAAVAAELSRPGAALAPQDRSAAAAAVPPAPASVVVPAPRRPPVRLSACLIVKDEEKVLGACLRALRGAVDEVVVYDTGSTDATADIAREHGAVVVLGHWDDHFGAARNRALEHCTGDWVLSVDADEVLTGDPTALRRACEAAPDGLARTTIVSTAWAGADDGQHSHPVRLFRPDRYTWVGALHEYLAPRPGQQPAQHAVMVEGAQLDHSGYQYLVFADKDKRARNLAIARAGVERLPVSGEDPSTAWDAYGRSLLVAGRPAEALEALDHVLATRGNDSAVVQAGRAALSCMRETGDLARAGRWLEALESHGEAPGAVDLWRGRLALHEGRTEDARHHLERAARSTAPDRWGVPFGPVAVELARAELALAQGRAPEAVDLLLASLVLDPEHLPLSTLLRALGAAGLEPAAVVGRLPAGFVARSAQEAVVLGPRAAQRWLAALHEARPDDAAVVLAGTVVGGRGTLEDAVAWSAAARRLGMAACCPLRVVGADASRPPLDRALAWALAAGVGGDEDAAAHLAAVLDGLAPAELLQVVPVVAELVPAVTGVLAEAVHRSAAPAGA